MELERVIAVRGPGGPGSGYLVASRLVATSAHVVGAVGSQVEMFRPGRVREFKGTVAWRGTPSGKNDAALVLIQDIDGESPSGLPIRWGRTVTFRPGLRCHTCGMPDIAQMPGKPAEVAQPSGTLNPGDGVIADRYVLSVDGPAPVSRSHQTQSSSPWGGMSGAPLFCGELLLGVVTADPTGWAHGKLAVVPAYLLFHDPTFRAVLARYGGRTGLEPAEWQHLAEPQPSADRDGAIPSPAGLLLARRATVPFRGRWDLLRDLESWAAGTGVAVRLVYGPGGQGKTRLAHELEARLTADRWTALWLREHAEPAHIEVLKDAAVPLLVVLDYAEARVAQLAALLEACALRTGSDPIRILLLARTAGSWWANAQNDMTALTSDLLDEAVATALPVLETDVAGTVSAYEDAVSALAAALPQVRGLGHLPWTRLVTEISTRGYAQLASRSALTLHMTALADLLDTADAADSHEPGDHEHGEPGHVEDRLLRHEYRYWDAAARTHRLQALTRTTLHEAMAAALLVGADSPGSADILLAKSPGLKDQFYDARREVRAWIAALYPPTVSGAPWDSLQPDRLAERFLGRQLIAYPELPDPFVQGLDRAQADRMLTFYARAAAHSVFEHSLDEPLTSLVVRHHEVLAPAAVDVVIQVEHPEPLLRALDEIVEYPDAVLGDLYQLAMGLPRTSVMLAGWAARLTQRLVDRYRQRAIDDPDGYRPYVGASLNILSVRLGDLGRYEEAAAAAEQAVDAYRKLTEADPRRYESELGAALNNFSYQISALGHSEEALAASENAVRIYEELAQVHPDKFQPGLAASLNNLSNHLQEAGRPDEALAAIERTIKIFRDLEENRPGVFQPNLATGLSNLANRLEDAGRPDEALAALESSVQIYRELAQIRADAFQPDLAKSLGKIAVLLGNLGRREDALTASEEAVQNYRKLAQNLPSTYQASLGRSLQTLSDQLEELGRTEEALAACLDAVQIQREVAQTGSDTFEPSLAASLNSLGNCLHRLQRDEEALAALAEALSIYRKVPENRVGDFQSHLAACLHNLAAQLGVLGRDEDALPVCEEAVRIRRELARTRPHDFQPDVASSLLNLSVRLERLGRGEEAVAAIEESVGIYRNLPRDQSMARRLAKTLGALEGRLRLLGRASEALDALSESVHIRQDLAQASPAEFLPSLGEDLHKLAFWLSKSNRDAEALVPITEAVQIRRELARANPEEYLSQFAQSLPIFFLILTKMGRKADALTAITEAVQVHRDLMWTHHDDFRPHLATCLVEQAELLHETGRREEALAAMTEVVQLRRDVASQSRSDEFQADLGASLRRITFYLATFGRRDQALVAINEAVQIYRKLANTHPALYRTALEDSERVFAIVNG